VDVGAVKRVRSALGVDLMQVAEKKDAEGGREPGVLERLASDPVLLVDVIYVLCRDQANALGVTDEDFGAAMAGDAIEHAVKAMLGAIVDFFPNPRERAALKRLLEAADQEADRARSKMEALVEEKLAPSPAGGSWPSRRPSSD
jgi:peptide subunit release factor RF-3